MTLVRAFVVAVVAMSGWRAFAQAGSSPTNDLPNPYKTVENYLKLPAGRVWGSTSAVDIDKDGRSVGVAERCGANSCADPATGAMSPLDPVLKFDATGKLVKSFGAGMIAFAHGIHVDRAGNIWVADAGDNRPRPARGAAAGSAPPSMVTWTCAFMSPGTTVRPFACHSRSPGRAVHPAAICRILPSALRRTPRSSRASTARRGCSRRSTTRTSRRFMGSRNPARSATS